MGHKAGMESLSGSSRLPQGAGFYAYDVPSGLTQGCRRLADYFGLPADACRKGLPVEVFLAAIHPEDRSRIEASIARAVESGKLFDERYRTLAAGGAVLPVRAEGLCFRDEAGRPLSFVGSVEPDGDDNEGDPPRRLIEHALAAHRLAGELRKPFAAYLIALALEDMGVILGPTPVD